MPDIGAYLNVYNTALVVLETKGFKIHFDQTHDHWYARKDGWEFLADDPMQLPGLAAIFEHHAPKTKSEYWWKIDQPDLLSRFDTPNK